MSSSTDLSAKRSLRFIEEQDGTRHELPTSGSVTVGRAPAAEGHVQISAPDDAGVEERHCVIGRTKSGGVALKDLGSRAGVRVNGEAVTSQRLAVGDLVQLGAVSLWIRDEREVEPEPSLGRLDGYRLERRLGRGGMGDVVLAVQESLDRRVALKLLKMSLAADKGFVTRFQAEAKNAAALSHPHVVHVYDVGLAEGRHYLAMEYMEGGTLEGRLDASGALPAEEVKRVLFETAQALAYAEERGIVHRDIKPENLMLDGTGRVKLADLGLAASSAVDDGDASDGNGERIMGTPHFMAPEQARGMGPDHRSDLYALGATAFRLLTGETPFSGESKRDILRAHFIAPVPRPSERKPGLTTALDGVIMRLMAKEPGERFQSAKALIAALNEVQLDAPAPKQGSKLPMLVGLLLVASVGAYLAFGPKDVDDPEPGPQTAGGSDPLANQSPNPLVDDLPAGPDLPAIPAANDAPPEDNEAALDALEERAQNAYRQLDGIDEPQARKVLLSEIIRDYPGSSAANDAFVELQAINAALATEANATASSEAFLAGRIAQLDSLIQQAPRRESGAPSEPLLLLHDLYALPLPPTEPHDITAAFLEARKQRAAQVLAEANAELDRLEAAAEESASSGDFEAYGLLLQDALNYLAQHALIVDAPLDAAPIGPAESAPPEEEVGIAGAAGKPFEPDAPPPVEPPVDPDNETDAPVEPLAFAEADHAELVELGLQDWLDRSATLTLKLDATQARAQAYHEAQVAADFAALGQRVHSGPSGQTGIGEALANGDFAALEATFTALSRELATDAAREQLTRLAFEAAQGAAVLAELERAYRAGDWRRNSMPHPSGGFAEAKAFTAKSLTLDSGSGERKYTWRDYRTNRAADNLPAAYEDVFKNRLTRDYTPAELGGIAAILRFAAVESTILIADSALVASDRERFSVRDLEDVQRAFDVALDWAARADAVGPDDLQTQLTRDERRAALWLAESLLARSRGEPAISAALTRQLLMERPFSLTALVLSNGRSDLPRR